MENITSKEPNIELQTRIIYREKRKTRTIAGKEQFKEHLHAPQIQSR